MAPGTDCFQTEDAAGYRPGVVAQRVLHEDGRTDDLVELCPYPHCPAQPRFEAGKSALPARCHPDSLAHLPESDVMYAS